MVLGFGIDHMVRMIGHDGSEILYPLLPEPHNRKSFHIQELISVAWDLDWRVTPFEPHPMATHDDSGLCNRLVEFQGGNYERMHKLLADYSGVLTGLSKQGSHHAVAWDCLEGRIYNPSGLPETLGSFSIQTFWAFTRN